MAKYKYKGVCIGGPHDGDTVECDEASFRVVTKEHRTETMPDGTVSKLIEWNAYHYDTQTKTFHWGQES